MTLDHELDRLRAVHAELWDDDARLVRLAPGATPGLDLRSLGLHSVRESALGALLDLGDGEVDRASAALDAVLLTQYDAPGTPWDGTFKVTAEEGDPPGADAVEWLHYDPNWRQFLGCTLALVADRFGDRLDPDLAARVADAAVRGARREPADRIPPWYTNPNLMQAWLATWAGRREGDRDLVDAGLARARRTARRFDETGDVDEYNSPTYDGVDLLALALWVADPPDPGLAGPGERMLAGIAGRVATLFHPATASVCGPYARAYGIGLDRYVSLIGLWLRAAGVDRPVLPADLDVGTVHVHDLYFAPLVSLLAEPVTPHLAVLGASPGGRRPPVAHEQRLGDVVATSRLDERVAVGAARGPVPAFARDQFVPLTVHAAGPTGTSWIGLRPHADVATTDARVVVGPGAEGTPQAPPGGGGTVARAELRADTGDGDGDGDGGGLGARILCSHVPAVEPGRAAVGDLLLRFDPAPDSFSIEHGPDAVVLGLAWPPPTAVIEVHVAGRG